MLSKQQWYLYVQADVNALLGWLEKEFDAKGGQTSLQNLALVELSYIRGIDI